MLGNLAHHGRAGFGTATRIGESPIPPGENRDSDLFRPHPATRRSTTAPRRGGRPSRGPCRYPRDAHPKRTAISIFSGVGLT